MPAAVACKSECKGRNCISSCFYNYTEIFRCRYRNESGGLQISHKNLNLAFLFQVLSVAVRYVGFKDRNVPSRKLIGVTSFVFQVECALEAIWQSLVSQGTSGQGRYI